MQLVRCTPQEYKSLFPNPSHVFNTVEFNELNRHKCDDVHYLAFNDYKGKTRLGIILGQRGNVLKSPFSAPFGGMEERGVQRVEHYLSALNLLREYSLTSGLSVIITLPPSIYDMTSRFAKLYCTLLSSGGCMSYADYNFHYPLWKYAGFKSHLWPEVRNKFNRTKRESFEFECRDGDDSAAAGIVYDIITRNHSALGYPVHMSLDDIKATASVIKIRFFIARHDGVAVAAAMVYDTTDEIGQVVYWGDLPEYRHLRPMNYLSYKVFGFYAGIGKTHLDIGPSSSDGHPSLGLCDFKSGLGCEITPKFTLTL